MEPKLIVKSPLVSVLLPVYNAAEHVEEAIQSILNQTFTDFELLIFNDGSTDESRTIIQNIKDERIRFFDYTQNSGYVAHLNKGLQLAQGAYIARMDADDIALPDRFAQQVALLEREPDVVLCGTALEAFGNIQTVIEVPITDREIRNQLPLYCPMGHPTVMFRKLVVDKHRLCYNEDYMPAEDYKLWYDFSKVGELRNLPNVLLRYRVHQHQISEYKKDLQRERADAIRLFQVLDQGMKLSEEEQKTYVVILSGEILKEPIELKRVTAVMQSFLRQNEQLGLYDPDKFLKFFRLRWLDLASNLQQYAPTLLAELIMPSAINTASLSLRVRFLVKCLFSWKVRK